MTRFAAIVCTLGLLALAGCGDESAGGPVTLDWFIFNEPSQAPVRVAERCSEQSDGRSASPPAACWRASSRRRPSRSRGTVLRYVREQSEEG